MKSIFEKIDERIQKLKTPQKALLWLIGTAFVIPILFVILTPEGGSIVLAFLGAVVMDRTYNYFKERYKKEWQSQLLTGVVLIIPFIIVTGLMVLLMFPICRWLLIQETLDIQFLNRELTYGLALCYEGEVDFVTLGFGAYVHYLLMPTFYLIYLILKAPFDLFRWVNNRTG